jgi:hypothetical protein
MVTERKITTREKMLRISFQCRALSVIFILEMHKILFKMPSAAADLSLSPLKQRAWLVHLIGEYLLMSIWHQAG